MMRIDAPCATCFSDFGSWLCGNTVHTPPSVSRGFGAYAKAKENQVVIDLVSGVHDAFARVGSPVLVECQVKRICVMAL